MLGQFAFLLLSVASLDGAPDELRRYDLLVYGGTPGGVACAVRAAREGLEVLVVSPERHLGGLLANGLSTMDTLYNGARAPLYDELRQGIHDYYRAKYGADSEQLKRSLPNRPKTKFEAHVAERIVDRMLLGEPRITVLRAYYPVAMERSGAELQGVTFRARSGNATFAVRAAVFADCSYEGDLLAVAKVPYRWGRESRDEFKEEHAGRIFMQVNSWPPPLDILQDYARFRTLNLAQYNRWYERVRPESTGEADQSVQGYNLRTVVTSDPQNRVPIEKPTGYDREEVVRRLKGDWHWSGGVPSVMMPNRKAYLNLPQVIGSQHVYVEGDWSTRQRVVDEHARVTRTLMYFMQHDESVPEATRRGWREWGLARDEFPDNDHLPYEIYARETRRLQGRYVFTENDARAKPLDVLTAPLAEAWAQAMVEWMAGKQVDRTERARRMLAAEEAQGLPLTVLEFTDLLGRAGKAAGLTLPIAKLTEEVQLARDVRLSRGNACRFMYAAGRKP